MVGGDNKGENAPAASAAENHIAISLETEVENESCLANTVARRGFTYRDRIDGWGNCHGQTWRVGWRPNMCGCQRSAMDEME
jgi:hypothetical protein